MIARDSNVELYNDLVVKVQTTFNEDSGDKDFRVESNGNTHMLFVDGGNNRVGVETSAHQNFSMLRVQLVVIS